MKLEVAGFTIFERVTAKIYKESIDRKLMELDPMGRDAIGQIVAELDSLRAPYLDKEAQIAELRETKM